jgi:predicted xylose isomerase-like sugar epimerase
MRQDVSGNIIHMRVLAARLRAQAAETGIEIYRRKFESLASELDEAATDLESRARFFAVRQVG